MSANPGEFSGLAMRMRDAEVASCLAMAHAAKAKQDLLARMTETTIADVA
jgi:hypothetical protein